MAVSPHSVRLLRWRGVTAHCPIPVPDNPDTAPGPRRDIGDLFGTSLAFFTYYTTNGIGMPPFLSIRNLSVSFLGAHARTEHRDPTPVEPVPVPTLSAPNRDGQMHRLSHSLQTRLRYIFFLNTIDSLTRYPLH